MAEILVALLISSFIFAYLHVQTKPKKEQIDELDAFDINYGLSLLFLFMSILLILIASWVMFTYELHDNALYFDDMGAFIGTSNHTLTFSDDIRSTLKTYTLSSVWIVLIVVALLILGFTVSAFKYALKKGRILRGHAE